MAGATPREPKGWSDTPSGKPKKNFDKGAAEVIILPHGEIWYRWIRGPVESIITPKLVLKSDMLLVL